MAVPRPIIVDTNIIFSALLRSQSRFADILLRPTLQFYTSERVVIELFKHKEKLVRLSRLPEDDILRLYYLLLRRINLYKDGLVSTENRQAAYALCQDVDETDAPHVALTLELNGLLWTGDTTLKTSLRAKGFDQFFEPGQSE